MIKHTWFKTTLAVAVATASCQLMANGLAINEQSVSSMGTGFAGRSSSALDASTVFGNPAGMSRLERAEISGGFAAIKASTDVNAANPDPATGTNLVQGTNDGDIAPEAAVPFAYYVRPLNDKWHFGLGFYVPFGVISDYEKSSQGRDLGLYSKVQVMTLQPTLSYRINDRVAVGFGPTINKIEGKLTSQPLAVTGSDATVNIKGDDIGYGFNAGVLIDVTDRLAWGLTYHSKVDYELEGRTRFAGFPQPLRGNYDATLDFTSPESVDSSITYKANDKWTLYAGATWTRWSQLEEIEAINEGAHPSLASVGEELNWEDSWAYAFGIAYQLNPAWVLRGGFTMDESPTSNADRTVRIPVSNRKIVSLGAGWNINQDWTMDFAYSYLRESKGRVDQSNHSTGTQYSAEYRNSAHGAGVQLTHRF